MDTEGYAGEALDHIGLGLERAGKVLHRIFAALAHLLHRRLIDIGREARRVDMHVPAPRIDEAADDGALDGDDVGEEVVHALVDGGGVFIGEALGNAVGADQRDLGRRLGDFRHRLVFVERDVAHQLQAADHRAAVGHRGAVAAQFRNFPALAGGRALDAAFIGAKGGGRGIEALDRGAEAFLEIEAAHLAVGQHVEADRFLQGHGLGHGALFERLEFGGRKLAFVELFAALLQVSGAQQAADDVGADLVKRHELLSPCLNGVLPVSADHK